MPGRYQSPDSNCMYTCNISSSVYLVKITVFSIKVIYSVYTGSLFGNLGVFLCIDVHFNLIKQHSRFPFYLIYLVC